MKSFKISLIAAIILTSAIIFAQGSDILTKTSTGTDKKAPDMSDYLFGEVKPDFKILSSTSSYIELEYYPSVVSEQKLFSNGEYFSTFEFLNGVDNDITKSGSPDLKFRNFSVFLP